jgi:hypothetical protein
VFKQKTEEEIVAAVRLRQRLRRPIGIFLMVLGMLAFSATIKTVHAFKNTLSQAVDIIQEHRDDPAVASGGRFKKVFVATHEAAYRSGKTLAYGTLLGLLMFSLGLGYAVGSKREDELLIRYFDTLNSSSGL